jgi:cystathionine beta-lyase
MQAASHRSLALAGTASLLAAGLLWRWRRRRCRREPWDFEALPDRSGVHTVKHVLPAALYGEAADGALNMWVADMELPCCGRIQRAIEERARHGTFGYTLQPREAWEAAGRWLVEKQGWQAAPDPSSFVFSASVVTSFVMVLEALTAPGDRVVVMTPLYGPLQRAVRATGRELVAHTLRPDATAAGRQGRQGRQGRLALELPRLEASLQGAALLLLCSPHNPTVQPRCMG